MKKVLVCFLVLSLFSSVGFLGCTKKAADPQQAIDHSKTLKTVDEQAKYLVSQANAFLSSKEFDNALRTAQYVLQNLDQNSQDAKSVLEKAKVELQKVAQSAVDDMKKKIGGLGQ